MLIKFPVSHTHTHTCTLLLAIKKKQTMENKILRKYEQSCHIISSFPKDMSSYQQSPLRCIPLSAVISKESLQQQLSKRKSSYQQAPSHSPKLRHSSDTIFFCSSWQYLFFLALLSTLMTVECIFFQHTHGWQSVACLAQCKIPRSCKKFLEVGMDREESRLYRRPQASL